MHSDASPAPPRAPVLRGALTGLLKASHPAPTLMVTALITALAAATGRSGPGCVLVASAVLSGQLSVGWSNDLVDRRRDIAAGRRDKPLVTGQARPRAVACAAMGALALCVPLSLACGALAGAAHLTGVAAAWTYNLGLKRTRLSWLAYAIGFGLLPAFLTLGLPGRPWPPAWLVVAGVLLGVGAHCTNVLPDIEADLAAGVRGLPQRLGPYRARVLAAAAFLCASAALVLGPPRPPGPVGWGGLLVTGALALTAVRGSGSALAGRRPFLLTLALAAADLALVLLRGPDLR